MVLQHTKRLLRALKSFSNPPTFSLILSEEEITSWCFARHTHGLMVHSKNLCHPTQTSDILPKKFLNKSKKNSHGSVLNKSIFCYNKITIFKLVPMDGQSLDSLELKVLTTALLVEM